MPPHLRLRHITMLALLSCLALGTVASAAEAAPIHPSKASCLKSTEYLPDGSGYFTSLRFSHVSCKFARRLFRAHWRCRTRNGKSVTGYCRSRVLKFRCREGERTANGRIGVDATEFDARVTCRRAMQSVVFTYQQNIE